MDERIVLYGHVYISQLIKNIESFKCKFAYITTKSLSLKILHVQEHPFEKIKKNLLVFVQIISEY